MIRTPTRPPVGATDPGEPGFAAVLSAVLPGLGQMYRARWRRGVLMLAAPLVGALVIAALLMIGPVVALAVRSPAYAALAVVGTMFAYHVAVTTDAFAGPTGLRVRRPVDAAILAAVLIGLAVAYFAAYREARALATVASAVFEQPTGRTVGPGTASGGTSAPAWSGTERLNVVLLGLDTRENAETQNTDTIMVVSVDPATKTGAMLSIPRDTLVDVPGAGESKVNAAYALGGDHGAELARQTVEDLLGIPIHSYAVIDFAAFRATIDDVGGIVVDVQRPLRDEFYPSGDNGVQRIAFRAGPQLMGGETALEFARSRHENNDFSRATRQQKVILALRQRVALLGLFRLPGIVERVGPLVRTDFDPANVLPLARLVLGIDGGAIRSGVLLPCGGDAPHCELEELNGPSGYYLVPDDRKVQTYVEELFSPDTPASSR